MRLRSYTLVQASSTFASDLSDFAPDETEMLMSGAVLATVIWPPTSNGVNEQHERGPSDPDERNSSSSGQKTVSPLLSMM